MKNFEAILESIVFLIPQQAARFVAYSLLTIGLVKAFRLAKEKIENTKV